MRRATSIIANGDWDPGTPSATVTLGWDDRHRRRITLTSDQGEAFLLDLPEVARLGHGDALVLDQGAPIRVIAAPEPVLEIRAGSAGLARLAYHLGNRHLPIEIAGDLLVIRADAVIAEMVRGLGGECREVHRPFTPEAGAYDTSAKPQPHSHQHSYERYDHHHGHDHGHDHDHD